MVVNVLFIVPPHHISNPLSLHHITRFTCSLSLVFPAIQHTNNRSSFLLLTTSLLLVFSGVKRREEEPYLGCDPDLSFGLTRHHVWSTCAAPFGYYLHMSIRYSIPINLSLARSLSPYHINVIVIFLLPMPSHLSLSARRLLGSTYSFSWIVISSRLLKSSVLCTASPTYKKYTLKE